MPLSAPAVWPNDIRSFEQWTRQVPVIPDPESVGTIELKDAQVTYAKLQAVAPVSIIGNLHATTQAPDAITFASDNLFLVRRSGLLTTDVIADTDIPATIARDAEVTAAIATALALALANGTYTPTLTNGTNLDASTAYVCSYSRVGTVVTVAGRVDVDPTAAGAVELGISLPVASNFTANTQCAGTAHSNLVEGQGAAILSDLTNDRASLQFVTADTSNRAMMFVFQYQIL